MITLLNGGTLFYPDLMGWNVRGGGDSPCNIYIALLPYTSPTGMISSVNLDEFLVDDTFGEEIRYNLDLPPWHRWSSIQHFKAGGTVMSIPVSTQDGLFRDNSGLYNLMNPSQPNRPYVIPARVSKNGFSWVGDVQHEWNLCCDAYYRGWTLHYYMIVDRFRLPAYLFPDTARLFFACYSISWRIDKDGAPHSTYSSESWYLSHGYTASVSFSILGSPDNFVTTDRRGWGDSFYLFIPGADIVNNPLSVKRRIREAITLRVSAGYFRWDRINKRSQEIALLPLSASSLHRPNYECIFSQGNRNPYWPELASQAYQDLGMSDVNGIAFLSELLSMGEEVRSFARTLKSIPSNRVKAAASAWLAVHYGFKLTLLDIGKLKETLALQAARDTRKSRIRASKQFSVDGVSYVARYQVFYNVFGQVDDLLDQLLQLSDATLTSENLWDMVPFSFVIDWFVQLGDVLQSLDNYANLSQIHQVIAAGKSILGRRQALQSMLGLSGRADIICDVQLSGYFRRYSSYLERPTLLPNVTLTPFNHLAEGAALVVSRK